MVVLNVQICEGIKVWIHKMISLHKNIIFLLKIVESLFTCNFWMTDQKMIRGLKILLKRYHCVQCFIFNLIRISLYPGYKFPHLSLSVSETNITMVKWFKTHAYRCQNVFYNEDITHKISGSPFHFRVAWLKPHPRVACFMANKIVFKLITFFQVSFKFHIGLIVV